MFSLLPLPERESHSYGVQIMVYNLKTKPQRDASCKSGMSVEVPIVLFGNLPASKQLAMKSHTRSLRVVEGIWEDCRFMFWNSKYLDANTKINATYLPCFVHMYERMRSEATLAVKCERCHRGRVVMTSVSSNEERIFQCFEMWTVQYSVCCSVSVRTLDIRTSVVVVPLCNVNDT